MRFENDPAIGWSLQVQGLSINTSVLQQSIPICSLNFGQSLNLGDSHPTYANTPVLQVITQGQGQTKTSEIPIPLASVRKHHQSIFTQEPTNSQVR